MIVSWQPCFVNTPPLSAISPMSVPMNFAVMENLLVSFGQTRTLCKASALLWGIFIYHVSTKK